MFLKDRGALAHARAFNARRSDPRYVFTVPVTLQRFLRFGPFITRGISLEISIRGMSALVCGTPRVGETVVIELPLVDSRIEMLATVRHSTSSHSGFEFYPLSPTAHAGIHHCISELRRHEESLFPCAYVKALTIGES